MNNMVNINNPNDGSCDEITYIKPNSIKLQAAILIFERLLSKGKDVKIRVDGYSMQPEIKEGDIITLERRSDYRRGDILAYKYRNEGLLLHRLVKIIDGTYLCKGDNAYRIEEITINDIFGKTTAVNGRSPKLWDDNLTELSLAVGLEFIKNKYDVESVKKSSVYFEYYNCIKALNII